MTFKELYEFWREINLDLWDSLTFLGRITMFPIFALAITFAFPIFAIIGLLFGYCDKAVNGFKSIGKLFFK